jgi:uncharacterized membrane protein
MSAVTEVENLGGRIVDEQRRGRLVQRSYVTASASGNTQVIAAQGTGLKIRVLSLFVMAASAVNVKFQSATNDVTATFAVGANGGFVLPRNVDGWFQTNANEALNVNLGGAVSTGVLVTWVQGE